MKKNNIELLASYWTLAGDTYPGAPSEISTFPLKARAEAAGKAGWKGLGFTYVDLVHLKDKLGLAQMKSMLADNDLRHIEVEFLTDWHLSGKRKQASDFKRDQLFDFASELGAKRVKCGAGFLEQSLDVQAMRDSFAEVCQLGEERGIDVAIEFMPFSSVNTIARGAAVTENLSPRAGLVVDSWHVAYGGMNMDEISKLPHGLIKGVELSDAAFLMSDDLLDLSNHHRKLIGEGEIDMAGFVRNIRATGFDGPWGVEIISYRYRKLPVEDVAKIVFESTMDFLVGIDD